MRQVINVKDIMGYFDRKERQSYKMMAEIKKHYQKQSFQPITPMEFANYYDVSIESITHVMQKNDLLKSEIIEQQQYQKELKKAEDKRAIEVKKQEQLKKLEAKEREVPRFTGRISQY